MPFCFVYPCYTSVVWKAQAMCNNYVILHNLHLLLRYECIQVLKDWHLALGVLASVLIDVLILLIYTIVEGAWGNLNAILVANREQPRDIVGVG